MQIYFFVAIFSTKFVSAIRYNCFVGVSCMTVYADVLVAVNTFINYFLLLLSAELNKTPYTHIRILFGALSGGILALTMFLQISAHIIDITIKIVTALIMVAISFGYKNLKCFLRNVFTLFTASYLFAGVMLGIWYVFKPKNILINNSVVYFDVSIVFLVTVTVLIYLSVTIFGSLLKRSAVSAQKCQVRLFLKEKSIILNAILDTGNSLEDFLNNREIITVDSKCLKNLCNGYELTSAKLSDRYRILPCKTVSGSTILEGVRCDKMEIEFSGKRYEFLSPLALSSKTEFSDDFNAVLNAEILMKLR